jgi:hypothetical protein
LYKEEFILREAERRRKVGLLQAKQAILAESLIPPDIKNKGLLELLDDAQDVYQPWLRDVRDEDEIQKSEDERLSEYYQAVTEQYLRNKALTEEMERGE